MKSILIIWIFSSCIALPANAQLSSPDTTLRFSYNAVSCTCAQWTETGRPGEPVYFFLEPANGQLVDADKLWDGITFPLKVEVTGRIVTLSGYPKNFRPTKGSASPAPVFRYTSITVIQNGDDRNSQQALVDSLATITAMPYICDMNSKDGCGDKIFWEVVKQKQSIVPLLIEKLSDTTTTLATVPNFGGQWTVADVAFAALEEIIKGIPTFELLGVEYNANGCGYCVYWDQVRETPDNRARFQANLRDWYSKNKSKLAWVESNDFRICDCRGKHPNGGHYELAK